MSPCRQNDFCISEKGRSFPNANGGNFSVRLIRALRTFLRRVSPINPCYLFPTIHGARQRQHLKKVFVVKLRPNLPIKSPHPVAHFIIDSRIHNSLLSCVPLTAFVWRRSQSQTIRQLRCHGTNDGSVQCSFLIAFGIVALLLRGCDGRHDR